MSGIVTGESTNHREMCARGLRRGWPANCEASAQKVWIVMNTLALVLMASAENAPLAADTQLRSDVETLTLARAIDIAMTNQPTVLRARASTEAAAARVDQAAASGLPQLNGSATYQRTTGNFVPRPGATVAAVQMAPPWKGTTYDFFNFGVAANQLIYDFGQTSGRKQAAESNRLAAAAEETTAVFGIRQQVQAAYFRVRAQRALIRVAQSSVENQQRHVEQIQGFVKAGLRPEIDLARVRTDLANARVQLITAENGYGLAKAGLTQSMGLSSTKPYEIADEEFPPVPVEEAESGTLIEDALRRRPERLALERQRQAQLQTIQGLKGAYGPTLTANAQATEAGVSLDHLVPNWFVGGTLSWPVLQGGLTKGQVREAEANLRVIETEITDLRLQVQRQLDEALLGIRASKAGVEAVAEAVANAQEQLRLAEGRYKTGLGNAIELSDSQQALSLAGAQAVQANFDLTIARASLGLALGQP